jgi:hypothetical protein
LSMMPMKTWSRAISLAEPLVRPVQAGQRVRGSLLAETITQYKVLVDIAEGSIIDSRHDRRGGNAIQEHSDG